MKKGQLALASFTKRAVNHAGKKGRTSRLHYLSLTEVPPFALSCFPFSAPILSLYAWAAQTIRMHFLSEGKREYDGVFRAAAGCAACPASSPLLSFLRCVTATVINLR